MMTFSDKKLRGFTLLEVLVSLFVFSLTLIATTEIFTSAYSGYRMTRNVQNDLENAQFAINSMAKALRSSSVVAPSSPDLDSSFVQFYDHSQGKCFHYRVSGGALQTASRDASSGVSECTSMSFTSSSSFTTVSTGTVTGSFRVTPSADIGGPPTQVGRVTVSLAVAADATHSARVQTSISLRDFGNIGL